MPTTDERLDKLQEGMVRVTAQLRALILLLTTPARYPEAIDKQLVDLGVKSEAKPTKKVRDLILSKNLTHNGNLVLTWMLGNSIVVTDSTDSVKIDKKKSEEKVDGAVALVMAVGRWMNNDSDSDINEIYKVAQR